MRSTHAPKACITGEACITHAVRITFRKERITQRSPFCLPTKGAFLSDAFLSERDAHFVRDAGFARDAHLQCVNSTHRITYHLHIAQAIYPSDMSLKNASFRYIIMLKEGAFW